MTKRIWALFGVFVVAGLTAGVSVASAHECPDGDTTSPECRETSVYPDWRPNYIPLFDLADRDEQGDGTDGEAQRYDAQRWRDECNNDGEFRQACQWSYGGFSITPSETDDSDTPRPNEWHLGFAANHCLTEAAHDCDSHHEGEFGTHDSHGGAIYVDVCLSENNDSKYCDDGLSDTQAGLTIIDHLDCPAGCFDEYHVVRPFDQPYTQKQMDNSVSYLSTLDPKAHACGYPEHSLCP